MPVKKQGITKACGTITMAHILRLNDKALLTAWREQGGKQDFALTHYNLGIAYFEQNQWKKAEKEWARALELKPDFAQAQKMLNDVRKKKPFL